MDNFPDLVRRGLHIRIIGHHTGAVDVGAEGEVGDVALVGAAGPDTAIPNLTHRQLKKLLVVRTWHQVPQKKTQEVH
jgi:hypothetical protein